MEFTNNFHDNDGGFLIDPNSPSQLGGKFARRDRPQRLAQQRLLRPARAPASGTTTPSCSTPAPPRRPQITPYVDGQAVPYTKLDSGTGAGNFANSTLYLMSRAGTSLFGNGDLDEVAIYNRALSAATIAEHYNSYGTNRRPVAAFNRLPPCPAPNQHGHLQRLRLQRSRRLDRQIRVGPRRQRDLRDRHAARPGRHAHLRHRGADGHNVGLRVTDNLTGTDTVTHGVSVARQPAADRLLHGQAEPGDRRTADDAQRLGLHDPDGTIAKYEWDLDGNGTLRDRHRHDRRRSTNTYNTAGTVNVGLRVTDNGGKTATSDRRR